MTVWGACMRMQAYLYMHIYQLIDVEKKKICNNKAKNGAFGNQKNELA